MEYYDYLELEEVRYKRKGELNLCYLTGKILNKVDLKFIYDNKRKSLSKQHTSIVELILELDNKSVIKAVGYDEIADSLYRKVNQEDYIFIEGTIKSILKNKLNITIIFFDIY